MKYSFCASSSARLCRLVSDECGIALGAAKTQIARGEVRVDGVKTKTDVLVQAGSVIEVFVPQSMSAGGAVKWTLLFADENMLAVDKPADCETQIGLLESVKQSYPSARCVHRLDRNTTGIVLFALNDQSERALRSASKNKQLTKTYLAVVVGNLTHAQTLTAFLKKDSQTSTVRVFSTKTEGADKIITAIKPLEWGQNTTLVEVRIVSGKTHQIRAHLAHIGHPILGDNKYGDYKLNRRQKLHRQRLRAFRIDFGILPPPLQALSGTSLQAKSQGFWEE